ncbi:MAG TPA: very short patch repair endonuclease [Candidatus Methylacidiphilales bacterium]|nr:very short patch repair endonuclease [Candidatus Methylacidiphilales bacterium]
MDVFSARERSRIMAAVHSKGNASTEKRMILAFRKNGITGWRRNYPLFGHPDFVFPSKKVVIFVDGCFWHGCKHCFQMPTSNVLYWTKKITRNRARDQEVGRYLKNHGWKVLRIAECKLKKENAQIKKLRMFLR